MRGGLALGVVIAAAGCATPQMTAVDLAARAERNMVEAQQTFAGKDLIVRGVVKSTSLAPRGYTQVSSVAWGRGMAVMSGTATSVKEQVPLVILQPGTVLCYFEPGDIGDVTPLHEGDSAAFACEVKYFEKFQGMAVSTLTNCRRKN
jgi:hypothetical protein